MAALVCDICGGKLTGKAGGLFVCESCGMEYDKTWAKEKIQEIKGTVQVEGKVDVSGSEVKVDTQKTLENYLKLSESALDSGSKENALSYANKAIEVDSTCVKAWILKMKAVGISKTKHPTINYCWGRNGEELAVDEDDKTLTFEAAKNAIINSVGESNISVSKEVLEVLFNDLLKYFEKSNLDITEGPCENGILAQGLDDRGIVCFNKYHEYSDSLIENTIKIIKLVPIETFFEYKRLQGYANRFTSLYLKELEEAEKRANRYVRSINKYDEILRKRKRYRDTINSTIEKAISECLKQIEAEKQKKLEAYWCEHAEEKEKLEVEKELLSQQLRELESARQKAVDELNKELDSRLVSLKQEVEALKEERTKLRKERDSLGLFKGKQKSALEEQIQQLSERITAAEENLHNKDREKRSKANKKYRSFDEQIRPLSTRINEINNELTKER